MNIAADIRQRLLRNGGILAYSRVALMFGQILTVPLLATRWGSGGYGEWLSLTAIASYISYSGIGLAPAARSDMTMEYVRGGVAGIRPAFQTAMLLIGSLSIITGSVFLSANALAPFAKNLNFHYITSGGSTAIVYAITLQIVLNLVNAVLFAAISATGRYSMTNAIEAARQTVEFVVLAIVVGIFKFPPTYAAWLYPTSAAIACGAAIISLQRFAPGLLTARWQPHLDVLRRLWRPMFGAFILNFGFNGLMVQAPRVVLAVVVGPTAVAAYAVAAMLLRLARIPMEIPSVSMLIELSLAYARGDMRLVRRMLQMSTRITFWISIVAAPILIIFGPDVVRVWSNGRLHVNRELIVILCTSTFAYSISVSSVVALEAINRVAAASVVFTVLSIPFVVSCWFLSRALGIIGAGLAVASLEIAFAVFVVVSASRIFGVDKQALAAYIAPPNIRLIRDRAVQFVRRQKLL
jgi:O-antigen/teichoic acid export membrane protein